MKKFEIYLATETFKDKKSICKGCTVDATEPELIASFDGKGEALAELKKYESDVRKYKHYNMMCYRVEEYYIAENNYEDDGEWESGGDIWEFSEMNITVEIDGVAIATYDNMTDAQKYSEKVLNELQERERNEDDFWIENYPEIWINGSFFE